MKRTVRTSLFTVTLNRTDGQYSQFRITARGPRPTFVFADQHEAIFKSSDFPGDPKTRYDRRWPKTADDEPLNGSHSVTFGFLGATDYTLLVQLCAADGTVIKVIKDIDYQREDQTDMFAELLRLTVK